MCTNNFQIDRGFYYYHKIFNTIDKIIYFIKAV